MEKRLPYCDINWYQVLNISLRFKHFTRISRRTIGFGFSIYYLKFWTHDDYCFLKIWSWFWISSQLLWEILSQLNKFKIISNNDFVDLSDCYNESWKYTFFLCLECVISRCVQLLNDAVVISNPCFQRIIFQEIYFWKEGGRHKIRLVAGIESRLVT